MNPISIVGEIIFIIFASAYIILFVLMLKNLSETGKDKFWNLSYQFCGFWIVSPELYNETGNRYRKILIKTILVGLPLIFILVIASETT